LGNKFSVPKEQWKLASYEVAGKIARINYVLKGRWKIEPFRRPFRTLTFLNRNQPQCGWLISDALCDWKTIARRTRRKSAI
jgi:hypothetical protein